MQVSSGISSQRSLFLRHVGYFTLHSLFFVQEGCVNGKTRAALTDHSIPWAIVQFWLVNDQVEIELKTLYTNYCPWHTLHSLVLPGPLVEHRGEYPQIWYSTSREAIRSVPTVLQEVKSSRKLWTSSESQICKRPTTIKKLRLLARNLGR